MKNKAPIAIIFICIFALIGLMVLANDSASKDRPVSDISSSDHVYGNPEAKIVLIEYSDFQCPACATYTLPIKEILDKYKSDVKFVYRHFPLPQHPNAIIASQYAEASGKQGKFWEMYEMLFDKQREWESLSGESLEIRYRSYGSLLSLDIEKLKKDAKSDEVQKKIEDDWKSGNRLKVNWTPTFYLDGVKLEKDIPGIGKGNFTPEDIENAIKSKISIKQ